MVDMTPYYTLTYVTEDGNWDTDPAIHGPIPKPLTSELMGDIAAEVTRFFLTAYPGSAEESVALAVDLISPFKTDGVMLTGTGQLCLNGGMWAELQIRKTFGRPEPVSRNSGTHVIYSDRVHGVMFGTIAINQGESEVMLTLNMPDLTIPDAEWVFEEVKDKSFDHAASTDWSCWLIRDGEVVKHAAMTNRVEYDHRRFTPRGPAIPVEVQQTPINTRNDPSRSDYIPANDSPYMCGRHGGVWGGDLTCERCTYEDGVAKPIPPMSV